MNFKIKTIIILFVTAISVQELTAQNAPAKGNIAVIDSYVFEDPQHGITKYVTLQKNVENEFKVRRDEITNLQAKVEALKKQYESKANNPEQLRKISDEAEALNQSLRTKGEAYQVQYQKRYNEMLSPLQIKLVASIKQWSNQKGFIAVIDVSKNENGFVLWIDEAAISATTTELIKYVNSVL